MASPPSEAARLSALSKCRILDTPAEHAFDELVRLAARASGCAMALLAFVDRERIWCKATLGLAMRELPREASPCEAMLHGASRSRTPPPTRASRSIPC